MDLKERRKIEILKRHPWEISRVHVIQDLLKKQIQTGKKIMDIGCGDLFLEECLLRKTIRPDFYCVDIAYSDAEVEILNQQYPQLKVYNKIDSPDLQQQKMDTVLLLDVIEHIENDQLFLSDIINKPFFTDNTCLVITVPAYNFLYSSHDRFLGHYRRYNKQKLSQLISESGLECQAIGYFYSTLLLPRFLQKIKEYFIPVNEGTTGLVEWKGAGWADRFLQQVLNLDYSIQKLFRKFGITLPGLSNYVICQKKHV